MMVKDLNVVGTGLSLVRRVRNNIEEISGGDLTARSLDHRELLLISYLTHGDAFQNVPKNG